jgi:hypothetical protein
LTASKPSPLGLIGRGAGDVSGPESGDGRVRFGRRSDDFADTTRTDDGHTSFLQKMAHELRTPLAVAREYVALVREGFVGDLSAEQRKHLDVAAESIDYLRRVIDDLMDLAQLDAGRGIRIDFRAARFEGIAHEVVELLAPRCESMGKQLAWSPAENLPIVLADPARVRQVLMNLLGNAMKFTPRNGRIELLAGHDPVRRQVRVVVGDTGVGIASEYHERIFEPFRQLEAQGSGDGAGSGLGLAIAKEIVTQHGGEIGVESEPGRGSRFWFTLRALCPEVIEELVIRPNLSRPWHGRGALSIVRVQVTDAGPHHITPEIVGRIQSRVRTTDRVLPLDGPVLVIIGCACPRAVRAMERRIRSVLNDEGISNAGIWTESVTYPSPGISREHFLQRARRLLRRAGGAGRE